MGSTESVKGLSESGGPTSKVVRGQCEDSQGLVLIKKRSGSRIIADMEWKGANRTRVRMPGRGGYK